MESAPHFGYRARKGRGEGVHEVLRIASHPPTRLRLGAGEVHSALMRTAMLTSALAGVAAAGRECFLPGFHCFCVLAPDKNSSRTRSTTRMVLVVLRKQELRAQREFLDYALNQSRE